MISEGYFGLGMLVGAIFGVLAGGFLDTIEPTDMQQQAFDRGYMVECIGKTGYYWKGECDE